MKFTASDSLTSSNLPDKPREACGIFGLYEPRQDVAGLTYLGLFALQHRGQESAGMVVSSGGELACFKGMGLVNQVFSDKVLGALKGWAASGHVRYSTTGTSVEVNAQPIFLSEGGLEIAVSHNGNLINTLNLRDELNRNDFKLEGTNDSEIIARLVHMKAAGNKSILPALHKTLPKLKGSFSLIIQTPHKIVGIRDPFGIRPLCIGRHGNNYVLSSETCALDIIGAEFVREVEPGELVVLERGNLRGERWAKKTKKSLCIFEYIYFARPDSYLNGRLVHTVRRKLGANLAKEAGSKKADIVVAVPDSGTPHAIGLAKELGLPYQEGLIKNRYIGRTFIQPDQEERKLGIRIKLNPLRDVLKGKKVLLVDDSIVRGNTSSQIVKLVREVGGAKEVHLMVCSPPIKHPCYYGIDTATREELMAADMTLPQMNARLGSDTLNYLSITGMVEATGLSPDNFCMACFDGEYPIPFKSQTRLKYPKLMLEENDEEKEKKKGKKKKKKKKGNAKGKGSTS